MRILFFSILTTLTFTLNGQMDTTSYSVGLVLAKNLQSQGLESLDQESFMDAFNDVFKGLEPKVSLQDANNNFRNLVEKKQAEAGAKVKDEGIAFLAENAKKEGVMTTASGLQYKVLEQGDASAAKPKATDKVNVHYHGTLIDGTVFDSSVDRGQPISFALNQVIPGWTEGVQLMNVGSKYRFYIPYDLAYGSRGAGGAIKPYAALIFDVSLLAIE